MSVQQTVLLQRLIHKESGREFDLSLLKEFVFIETLDLSGPRLVIKFDDQHALVRDYMGVRPGDTLTVTVADIQHRDQLNEVFDAVIMTMPFKDPLLTLNCFHAEVHRLKTPVVEARLFANHSPSTILRSLVPGVRYDIDRFPVVETYHLLPGERRSLVIKQIARETAAHIYFVLNTLHMKRLADIYTEPSPMAPYEWANPRVENQIVQVRQVGGDQIIKDRVQKRYAGFSLTQGFIYANNQECRETEPASIENRSTLNNLSTVSMPVIDFICMGNGALRPGIPLDFVWHTAVDGFPIDESLPNHAVTGTVSHYQTIDNYYCRVKMLLPLEMA